MKISIQKNHPGHLLPTVTGSGPLARMRIPTEWEFANWASSAQSAIEATGYKVSANVNSKGQVTLKFEGDTYSKEQYPPFAVNVDTKVVDKFSDLTKLDETRIGKVWGDFIAFTCTLPQPGDRGFETYMQLNAHCKELDIAESKSWHASIKYESRITTLEDALCMLQKQLVKLESVKAQLAEANTALRVLTGLCKN